MNTCSKRLGRLAAGDGLGRRSARKASACASSFSGPRRIAIGRSRSNPQGRPYSPMGWWMNGLFQIQPATRLTVCNRGRRHVPEGQALFPVESRRFGFQGS